MSEKQELTRTTFGQGYIKFGQQELANLCGTLIRIYKFKNSNNLPDKIILPELKEVFGVKIEWPTVAKSRPSKAGDGDS